LAFDPRVERATSYQKEDVNAITGKVLNMAKADATSSTMRR
jgi:hypothetical protein